MRRARQKATQIWCLHARSLESKPGRADLWLRSELEIKAETLGCAYVIPPIGSYDEQVVACNGSVRFRRNRFHKRWSREGTRLPVGERRMLGRFTRLPTDDEIKFVADLMVAMQAKGDDCSLGRAGPLY